MSDSEDGGIGCLIVIGVIAYFGYHWLFSHPDKNNVKIIEQKPAIHQNATPNKDEIKNTINKVLQNGQHAMNQVFNKVQEKLNENDNSVTVIKPKEKVSKPKPKKEKPKVVEKPSIPKPVQPKQKNNLPKLKPI